MTQNANLFFYDVDIQLILELKQFWKISSSLSRDFFLGHPTILTRFEDNKWTISKGEGKFKTSDYNKGMNCNSIGL